MQQLKHLQIQFVFMSSSSTMSLSSESLALSFLLPQSNAISRWWLTTTIVTATAPIATTAKILHKSQKKTFNKHKFKRIQQITIVNDLNMNMNMNMISHYYDSNAMTFNVSNNINNINNNTKNTTKYPFMCHYPNYYEHASCFNYYNNNKTESINIKTKPIPFNQSTAVTYRSKISSEAAKIRSLLEVTNAKLAYPNTPVGSIEKASFPTQVAKNKIKYTDNMKTTKYAITPSRAIPCPIITSITPISSTQFIAIREAARLTIITKLNMLLFSIVYYIYNFLNLYRHRKSFRRKSDTYNTILKTNQTNQMSSTNPYNIDIIALSKWSYIS